MGVDIIPLVQLHLFANWRNTPDGTIEFREFICGLNVLSSGSFEDKLLLTFRTFDLDSSGKLTSRHFVPSVL